MVRPRAIEVGESCLIHSNVVITPGCRIADRCIVAAGAVVIVIAMRRRSREVVGDRTSGD